ncbi:RuvC family protein [Orenia marismortui]|uniref:Holliday junction resolvase RuvX n=1 Tax=Orenia marismortui TaxID=46469 RepID=UPI000373FAC7|nr:Holliday junction resolvase RuvX [Orenia marismortui]
MLIGIDPGKDKCGIAVVDSDLNIIFKEVIATNQLLSKLKVLKDKYQAKEVVLGDGTKSQEVESDLHQLFKEVNVVNEAYSTLEARKYYWKDNPPKGWRRLIPTSMQTPLEPVDDYVAVILIFRYLENKI